MLLDVYEKVVYIWELRVGYETTTVDMQAATKVTLCLFNDTHVCFLCFFQVGFSDSTGVNAVLLGNSDLNLGYCSPRSDSSRFYFFLFTAVVLMKVLSHDAAL